MFKTHCIEHTSAGEHLHVADMSRSPPGNASSDKLAKEIRTVAYLWHGVHSIPPTMQTFLSYPAWCTLRKLNLNRV